MVILSGNGKYEINPKGTEVISLLKALNLVKSIHNIPKWKITNWQYQHYQ